MSAGQPNRLLSLLKVFTRALRVFGCGPPQGTCLQARWGRVMLQMFSWARACSMLCRLRFIMRGSLLLGLLAALMIPATALARHPTTRSVHSNLRAPVGTIDNDNSCCVMARHVTGSTNIPGLGKLSYSGEVDVVQIEGTRDAYLFLQFDDGAGDTFQMFGPSEQVPITEQPPPGNWSIDNGTGSFAALTGSGTYALDFNVDDTTVDPIRVRLEGTYSTS
jgi:hypothetical protein